MSVTLHDFWSILSGPRRLFRKVPMEMTGLRVAPFQAGACKRAGCRPDARSMVPWRSKRRQYPPPGDARLQIRLPYHLMQDTPSPVVIRLQIIGLANGGAAVSSELAGCGRWNISSSCSYDLPPTQDVEGGRETGRQGLPCQSCKLSMVWWAIICGVSWELGGHGLFTLRAGPHLLPSATRCTWSTLDPSVSLPRGLQLFFVSYV